MNPARAEISEAIREIVSPLHSQYAFDSHFVIDQLFVNYPEVYRLFVNYFSGGENSLRQIHGHISQEIGRMSDQVDRLPNRSWSKNKSGTICSCALWVKL